MACIFLLPALYGCASKNESTVTQMITAEEGVAIISNEGKMMLDAPARAHDIREKGLAADVSVGLRLTRLRNQH